ncbi:MAG TPA: nitroreductase/quinone reductase family protein [Thermodesulfobacteriota bacterium]|nr:nitroreductase/quinone reductase family protein [Thermodesulfobacteriota bacterium]
MTTEPAAASSGAQYPHWIVKTFARAQVSLNRLSDGRLFNSFGGREICFVTMKGAKSGRTLTLPLMYVPYRDGVLLVASLGGAPANPVWYHNIVKYPEIVVRHRGRSMKLRARLAAPEEKPALWPVCDQYFPPYADYRKRTTRDIPIFVCEPYPIN